MYEQIRDTVKLETFDELAGLDLTHEDRFIDLQELPRIMDVTSMAITDVNQKSTELWDRFLEEEGKADYSEKEVREIINFILQTAIAGRATMDPEERQALRSILVFWRSVLKEFNGLVIHVPELERPPEHHSRPEGLN